MILHRRVLIHVEWHKGYNLLPHIRVRLEPQPGDVVKGGDHVDRLIRCPLCSGDGTLLAAVDGTTYETTQRIGGERTIREEWQARRPGQPFPFDQLAHIVGPVDLTRRKGGPEYLACGEEITSSTVMAMSPAGISCPLCAVAYAADPSLLGPT